MKALRLAALAVVLLLLSGACRPLYVPPLIEGSQPEERARLQLDLVLQDGRPQLEVGVLSVAREGWLAVQWFSPFGREVASDSIWLDEGSTGLRHVLPLPADVPLQPGEWRVLLSQHSLVIRQLTVLVRAGG